jgi:hypothetical protein
MCRPKLIGESYLKKIGTKSRRYGVYECPACGKHWECRVDCVNSGNSTRCGCSHPGNETHGKTATKEYAAWKNMRTWYHSL